MAEVGDRIAAIVESLRARGFAITQRSRDGEVTYELSGDSYHIDVTVNPSRWLGLRLRLGTRERPALVYDIDTDRYDLARARFAAFARSVEDAIVAFLEAFADGQVRAGKLGRRPALLLPAGKRTVLVVHSRFGGTKVRRAPSSLSGKGGFAPLSGHGGSTPLSGDGGSTPLS